MTKTTRARYTLEFKEEAVRLVNAVTETLFGSLKVERLHGMRFETRRTAIDEVID